MRKTSAIPEPGIYAPPAHARSRAASTRLRTANCAARARSRAARASLRADADYDGRVTLDELYVYAARRVMWYLRLTGQLTGAATDYVQSVQVLTHSR